MPEQTPAENEHERLIQLYQKQLRGYILVISPNHSAMEDILQETNRVLWQKRNEFQAGTNFLAWARKIAQFQTMNYLKKLKSKSWLHFDSSLVQTLANAVDERDDRRSGHQQLIEESLSDCLNGLPQGDRELIDMRYRKRMSLKEISEKTGRSEGGLKQVFMRIRKVLRECIERKTVQDR